jgi:hypothetical protein
MVTLSVYTLCGQPFSLKKVGRKGLEKKQNQTSTVINFFLKMQYFNF